MKYGLVNFWSDKGKQTMMVGSDSLGIDELEGGMFDSISNVIINIMGSRRGEREDALGNGEGEDDCLLARKKSTPRVKYN